MKNLLFVLCLVVSTTLFYSCGDDDESNDPQTEIVTGVTNTIKDKYFQIVDNGVKKGYYFNSDGSVDTWNIESEDSYQYAKGSFSVTEKYIVITVDKTTYYLYFDYTTNKITIYKDESKSNALSQQDKPTWLENETKEPNKDVVILSLDTHYTDFNTEDFIGSDNKERIMYVKDKKTNETILTFTWFNYNDMPQIGRVDVKNRGNLLGYMSGSLYITTIVDSKGKLYAFNTTTNNVVKVVRTVQIANTMKKITTLSVDLEGKYVGEISIVF